MGLSGAAKTTKVLTCRHRYIILITLTSTCLLRFFLQLQHDFVFKNIGRDITGIHLFHQTIMRLQVKRWDSISTFPPRSLPHCFLVWPQFSFRTALFPILRTTKKKHSKKPPVLKLTKVIRYFVGHTFYTKQKFFLYFRSITKLVLHWSL